MDLGLPISIGLVLGAAVGLAVAIYLPVPSRLLKRLLFVPVVLLMTATGGGIGVIVGDWGRNSDEQGVVPLYVVMMVVVPLVAGRPGHRWPWLAFTMLAYPSLVLLILRVLPSSRPPYTPSIELVIWSLFLAYVVFRRIRGDWAPARVAPAPEAGFLNQRGLYLLAALVYTCGVARVLWFIAIEPVLITRDYERKMQALRIERVEEAPLLFEGETAGLLLTVHLRMDRDMPMDHIGKSVFLMMRSPRAGPVGKRGGGAPFSDPNRSRVTLDGVELADLPGIRDWQESGYKEVGNEVILPAGLYHIDLQAWFQGLIAADPNRYGKLCREGEAPTVSNQPLQVGFVGGIDLSERRGNRQFRPAIPLAYQFDAARWAEVLPTLPLPLCSDLLKAMNRSPVS